MVYILGLSSRTRIPLGRCLPRRVICAITSGAVAPRIQDVCQGRHLLPSHHHGAPKGPPSLSRPNSFLPLWKRSTTRNLTKFFSGGQVSPEYRFVSKLFDQVFHEFVFHETRLYRGGVIIKFEHLPRENPSIRVQ